MAAVVGLCSLALGAGKPVATIQIASLDQMASEMVMLKALPESNAKMMLTTGFGAMLGNPALAGVDMTRPIDLYIFLPPVESVRSNTVAGPVEGPGVAFVFSALSNKMDCLAAMTRTFPATNMVGSLYEFSSGRTGHGGRERKMFVGFGADRIIAGSNLEAVRGTVDLVERQKGESALFMKLTGTLRGGVDVQVLAPYVQAMSELASARMGQVGAVNPGQPDPGQILKAEMDLFMKLIGDIHGYSFSLSVTPESVNILSRLDPKDGTVISKLVAGDVPPSARYMALPPPDALCFWVGSGLDKSMAVFGEPYMAMIDKIGAAMGPQGGDMGSVFRQMMTDMKGLYASDIAVAVVSGADGKLGVVEYVAVTDPVRMKQTIDKMMSNYNSTAAAKAQGIEIRMGSERAFRGVKIQSYSYAVNAVSNMPLQAVSNLMSRMKWESAFVGNNMIYALGHPDLMNAAIDRLSVSDAVPVTSAPSFARVFPQVKGTPACVYAVSLVKLAKKGMALVPGVDPAQLAAIPDRTGGMAGYVTINGDNLLLTDRIMLDEIEGLKAVLPMLGNILPALLTPQRSSSSRRPHAGAHQGDMPADDSEEEAE